MRAAALAVPFESPKLAVVAQIKESDFGAMLERAQARSAKAFLASQKVIVDQIYWGDFLPGARQQLHKNNHLKCTVVQGRFLASWSLVARWLIISSYLR
jgi:hypothetical protein